MIGAPFFCAVVKLIARECILSYSKSQDALAKHFEQFAHCAHWSEFPLRVVVGKGADGAPFKEQAPC
eukprot:5141250-Amphidinium_carterae.1